MFVIYIVLSLLLVLVVLELLVYGRWGQICIKFKSTYVDVKGNKLESYDGAHGGVYNEDAKRHPKRELLTRHFVLCCDHKNKLT